MKLCVVCHEEYLTILLIKEYSIYNYLRIPQRSYRGVRWRFLLVEPVPRVLVLLYLRVVVRGVHERLSVWAEPERSVQPEDFCFVKEVGDAVEDHPWDS